MFLVKLFTVHTGSGTTSSASSFFFFVAAAVRLVSVVSCHWCGRHRGLGVHISFVRSVYRTQTWGLVLVEISLGQDGQVTRLQNRTFDVVKLDEFGTMTTKKMVNSSKDDGCLEA